MLDFFRDLGKSEEEKRQERITAYLDNTLSSGQRQQFEEWLATDAALRQDVEQQRQIKASLRGLPRLKAPRHFTLDPALYSKPEPATAARLYPALRVATALASILFVVALSAQLIIGSGRLVSAPSLMSGDELAQEVADAPEAAEIEAESALPIEEVAREVIVEVEEEAAAEEPLAAGAEMAEEAPMEAPVAEMPAEEGVVVVTEVAAEAEGEFPPPVEEPSAGGGIQPTATEAMAVAEEVSTMPFPTATPTSELGFDRAAENAEDEAAPPPLPTPRVEPSLSPEELLAQKATSESARSETQQDDLLASQPDTAEQPAGEPLDVFELFLIGLGIAVVLLAIATYWLGRKA